MPDSRDDEVAREIETHLELEAEEQVASGMSTRDAHHAARTAFGSVTQTREDVRAVWTRVWLEQFTQDVRYALRTFVKNPAFTAVAVATLAIGIGANTAMFSVLHAVMLRPLGYPQPERLMLMTTRVEGFDRFWASAPEYFELTELSQSFSTIGAFRTGEANVSALDQPRRVKTADVNVELLEALSVRPARGRWFERQEVRPNAAPTAMLSHDLWQSAFGSREDIVGATIELNGVRRQVVGVMPAGFDVMDNGIDVWLPLFLDPANREEWNRLTHMFYLIGRLKDGVSEVEARSELQALLSNWGERVGAGGHTFKPGTHVLQMEPLQDAIVGSVGRAIWILQAAVAFVLLIACTNLANLLLARTELRARELAIRTAIGAARRRLLTQFVIEGLTLSALGAVAGIGLAWAGVRTLTGAYAEALPRGEEISLDPVVLGFAVLAAGLTGVVFGLVPMLHVPQLALAKSLNEIGARGSTSVRYTLRRALVAVQVALAVLLVVGAGLMVRTIMNLLRVDAGFERRNLVTFGVDLPGSRYPTFAQRHQVYARLMERLGALPGVERVSTVSGLPPQRQFNAIGTDVEDSTLPFEGGRLFYVVDYYQSVGVGAFETLGIPIVKGRPFQPADVGGGPVVVVNETFASKFWPGLDPIGRRVRSRFGGETAWATVIGVARDVKQGGIDQATGTEIYYLLDQIPRIFPQWVNGNWDSGGMKFVLRSSLAAAALQPAIAAAIQESDPTLPVIRLRAIEDVVRDSLRRPRMLTHLFVGFAALALFLAAVGTYSVLSYMVTARRREIGVCLALGAPRQTILRSVMGQGMKLAVIGLLVGLASALALTQLMQALLFGVDPQDASTLVGVVVTIAVIAALASGIPAYRATRVDPVVALRADG